MANVVSEFHILPSASIPSALPGNTSAPWKSFGPSKCRLPTNIETTYVIWANSQIDELCLPGTSDFQKRAQQAMNVKQKFSLLKDVQPETFADILGEVIKVYEGPGYVTIYLSDYTANTLFYNYAWGGGVSEPRDGDEFGYIKSKPKTTKDWPGPYGKMTIQLTLFDGHADFVRDKKVQAKQWLLLKNVRIRYGKMGGCLEGALRGDRDAFEGKVQVHIMEPSDEPRENDIRWKEAVRRKHDWWKKFEKQKQAILDDAAGLGDKRKAVGQVMKKNSKQRRKELRAATVGKAAEVEAKAAKKLDLNIHGMLINTPKHSSLTFRSTMQSS